MKTKQIFSLLLTVLVLTSSMVVAQTTAGNDKVVFDVNMHCEACQKKIEKNIAFEKGVKAMEVSLENKTVALTYDAKKTSPEKLQAALVKLGYKADVKSDKVCSDKLIASATCQSAKPAGGCKDKAKSECKDKAAGECKDKAKGECKDKTAGCCDNSKGECKDKVAGECKDKAKGECKDKTAGCCDNSKGECKDKVAGECKDKVKGECKEQKAGCQTGTADCKTEKKSA